jgi:hypothetical protein
MSRPIRGRAQCGPATTGGDDCVLERDRLPRRGRDLERGHRAVDGIRDVEVEGAAECRRWWG